MSADHIAIEAAEAPASEINTIIGEERARADLLSYIQAEINKGRFYPILIVELSEQISQLANKFAVTRQFDISSGQYLYDAEIMLLAELLFSRYPQYVNPLAEINGPVDYYSAIQRLGEEYENSVITAATRGEKYNLVTDLVEEFINTVITQHGQPIKLGLRRILQICEQVTENVYNIYEGVPAFAALTDDDPYLISFLNKAIVHYFASFWVVPMD